MSPAPIRAQEGDEHPRLRWEWFHRQRAYPFAEIPAGALDRAQVQAAALRARAPFLAPPIAGTRWEPLGPQGIPINLTSIGRLTTIAIHPTQPSTIYIGGAQGGVWRSTNGGTSWTPLTDTQCSLAMGSIAIDPVAPSIIYAATGEQSFSGGSYYGCGVLRSTDGGTTWTRLGATTFVQSRIARLVVVPSTAGNPGTTTLFAASDNGLWRSDNGGGNWTLVRSGTATDFVLSPTDDQSGYVGIRGAGVFRTTDRGASWAPLGSGFPGIGLSRIKLAVAPTAPSTVVAAVENGANGRLLGMWRTLDAAASWGPLTASGAGCGAQCWYNMVLAFDPTNASTLYFGGVDLYRSLDGGATFARITNGIHVDQHAIAFDPTNAAKVYAGNDGGIYRSDDGGLSWTSLNTGLALTQFYPGISLHPSDRAIVLGGTQDNGTLRFVGSPVWSAVLGGDGGFTAIDPNDPAIQYAETQWASNSWYSGPRRSTGGDFELKTNGINLGDPGAFIPALVMDPTDSRVLYFATNRIYRTADRAESWTAISPVLASGDYHEIKAIAPAPADPARLYVGTSLGWVYASPDGGVTWPRRDVGLPPRSITDIAVDRSDPATAYVTLSGFGTGHVYRTTDAGVTWRNVSGPLPDVPVNAVVLDPASRAFVMIGTDLGVFVSADSGGSWVQLSDGMPNVAVFDLAYNAATGSLIAATYGRGMYQLALNRPLTLAVAPARRQRTLLEGSTLPASDSIAVILSGTGAAAAAWSATHTGGSRLTLVTASGTGSGRLRWTRNPAALPPGTYVDTISVLSAGAFDSPARVIDTMFIQAAPPILSLTPLTRRDTVTFGATTARADSAAVLLSGSTAGTTPWTATKSAGWLALTTASGTGSGILRWTRSPAGLPAGTFVDSIRITASGATGSPTRVIDSLVVLPSFLLTPGSSRQAAVSGAPDSVIATLTLAIGGDPSGQVPWTVSRRQPWNVLTTASGLGAGTVTWKRTGYSLRDGVYVDTITVTSGPSMVQVIDTLVVTAPSVAARCAGDHLLGAGCLNATQLRWLDLAGNADGQFNLGDLVAFFARAGLPPPVPPAEPPPPRSRR